MRLFSIPSLNIPENNDRCILVTADNIFDREDIKHLLQTTGVKLERVKSAGAMWRDLFDHVWKDIREPWVRQQESIGADLNTQKDAVGAQIAEFIKQSGIDKDLWIRAKIRNEMQITAFNFIKTDLPDSDHLPPRTAYSRPEASKIPISARATAEMKALVEHSEWSSIVSTQSEGPSAVPGLDHATLTEYLTSLRNFSQSRSGISLGAAYRRLLHVERMGS